MYKYTGKIYEKEFTDTLYQNDPRTLEEILHLPRGRVTFVANGEMADGSLTYQLLEDYEKRDGWTETGYFVQYQRDRRGNFYILTVDGYGH